MDNIHHYIVVCKDATGHLTIETDPHEYDYSIPYITDLVSATIMAKQRNIQYPSSNHYVINISKECEVPL